MMPQVHRQPANDQIDADYARAVGGMLDRPEVTEQRVLAGLGSPGGAGRGVSLP
jgi:hypothetical protein